MLKRAVVLAGLLLYFVPANGQSSEVFSWKNDKGDMDSLRLFQERCSDPAVLKEMMLKVPPQFHELFKRSVLFWEGKKYEACSAINPNNDVVTIDEKGDFLMPAIPKRLFKDLSI